MALAHCILGKFLGVGCHCFPPSLDVPTFSARWLHVQRRERPLAAEGGTLRRREMFRQISSRIRLPRNSRELLHAANLRHGTDGFTSPPKEGVLRTSLPLKIQRTWVPKASTLPLDHRSRCSSICIFLFNRTTLQVFVPYLTCGLYVHPLWFYKHQHDNRVRSKLSVAWQRWWFQWRFAAILVNCAPSGEMHNYCTSRSKRRNA
jgi:hypothetical protein